MRATCPGWKGCGVSDRGAGLRLILAALAVFRLACLLTSEDGPVYVFKKFRSAVGRWASTLPVEDEAGLSIAELVHCPYCLGVWLAAGAALLVLRPSRLGDLVLMWLGLAGGQAYLQGRR
jgi:hypothetical protein